MSSVTAKLNTASAPATIPVLTQGTGANSKTLTLTGVVAGTSVKIMNGTTDVTSKFTVLNGVYTAKPGAFDGSGTYSFTAVVTDASGNSSTSAAVTGMIDTTPPATPTLTQGTGVNSKTLTVSNVEAGATVTIMNGATDVTSKFTVLKGVYTAKPGAFDGLGTYSFTAVVTDASGNSSTSAAVTGIIDTTPPATPVLSQAIGAKSKTLILNGLESGASVKILDGVTDVTANFTQGINGTFVANTGVYKGSETLSLTVVVTDAFGNQSPSSNILNCSIDSSPPARPSTLTLTASSDTGVSTTDRITKNNKPVFSGVVEPLSTVTLKEGSTVLGTATADANGNFTVQSITLSEGTHSVVVTATDKSGNISIPSDVINIKILTTPPSAPKILTTGIVTSHVPTIIGTASALATINLMIGSKNIGQAVADTSGNWSITLLSSSALADGNYSMTATATDLAGNVSVPATAQSLIISTTPMTISVADLAKYMNSSAPVIVKDTAANISTNIDKIIAMTNLNSVIQTDVNSGKSLSITAAQYFNSQNLFKIFDNAYLVNVTNAALNQADLLQADKHIISYQLNSSTSELASQFDVLNNQVLAWTHIQKSGSILISDQNSINLTSTQYSVDKNIEAVLGGAATYSLTDVLNDADGLALSANSNIVSIKIADTVAQITHDLDKLNAASNIKSITFTDSAPGALNLTYTQLIANTNALAKLPSNYKVTVSDVPANKIGDVLANAHVVGMTVTDTMANLLTLIKADSKGVSGSISNPLIVSVKISDNASASAQATSSAKAAGPTPISIADAMIIASLQNLASPPQFMIKDTAANVIAHERFDILGVFKNTANITLTNSPATLTVADLSTLAKFYVSTLTGGSVTSAPPLTGSASASKTNISLNLPSTGTLTAIPLTTTLTGAAASTVKPTVAFQLNSTQYTGTLYATGSYANGFTVVSGSLTNLATNTAITVNGGSFNATPPAYVNSNGTALLTGSPYNLVDTKTGLLAASTQITSNALTATIATPMLVSQATSLTKNVLLASPYMIKDTAASIIAQANIANDKIISGAAAVVVSDKDANIIASLDNLEKLSKNGLITDIFSTDAQLSDFQNLTDQLSSDFDALGRIVNVDLTSLSPAKPIVMPVPVLSAPAIVNSQNLTVTITGSAKPNSYVTISDSNNHFTPKQVVADAKGNWNLLLPITDNNGTKLIMDGTYKLSASASLQVDGSGSSLSSQPVTMLVDTAAPNPPVVTLPSSITSNLTNLNTFTISGTADSTTTSVQIYDGTQLVATKSVVSGIWSYTPTKPFSDGVHNFTARAVDAAGNISQPSYDASSNTPNPALITIDTIAPNAPVITNNVLTNAATKVTITGTAEKGSQIKVYDGSTLIGTTAASSIDGSWSLITPNSTTSGQHSFSARSIDAAGNISAPSPSVVFNLGVNIVTFSSPQTISVGGDYNRGPIYADFNGDSIKDLVFDGSYFYELQGVQPVANSNVVFGASKTIQNVWAGYSNIIAVDLDGDNKSEIVATPQWAYSLAVFSQSGSGNTATLGQTQSIQFGSVSAGLPIAADFNNDKKMDILLSAGDLSYASVFLNDGSGKLLNAKQVQLGFAPNSGSFAIDYNNDSKMDIVGISNTGKISVTLGDGAGNFSQAVSLVLPSTSGSGPAIAWNLSSASVIKEINSNINYIVAAETAVTKGNIDIFQTSMTSTAPSLVFKSSLMIPTGMGDHAVQIKYADLNNDGKIDLVVRTQTDEANNWLVAFMGNGDGTFQTGQKLAYQWYGADYTIGDFNNDSYADIAWQNWGQGNALIYLQTGVDAPPAGGGNGGGVGPIQNGGGNSITTPTLTWNGISTGIYEQTADSGNKTIKSDTAVETINVIAGAKYEVFSSYSSYGGVTLSVLDNSPTPLVVKTTVTPENGLSFTASTTGLYTLKLTSPSSKPQGNIVSYDLKISQDLSVLPSSSGDPNVNALLGGTWWHSPGALADPNGVLIHTGLNALTASSSRHEITYSFLAMAPSGQDGVGFQMMTSVQQAAVVKALNYISTLINVKFTLANTAGQADINFGTNNQASSAGYANPPYQGGSHASYLMLANNVVTNGDFSAGSYGWETLLHEIGHTLGLKHPGAYNAGGGTTQGPYLSSAFDNRKYTIMSYNNPSDAATVSESVKAANGSYSYWQNFINQQSFMLYDIEALQYLYGANTSPNVVGSTTTAQTFSFAANYQGFQTLWAPQIGSTIDVSKISSPNIIDLNSGNYSSIGIQGAPSTMTYAPEKALWTYTGMNNVAIAYGSSITNVMGGSGSDVIYANASSDYIDGCSGNDTVYLLGAQADWTPVVVDSTTTKYTKGAVTETLISIENVKYIDPAQLTQTHDVAVLSGSPQLSSAVTSFIQSIASMSTITAAIDTSVSGDMPIQKTLTFMAPKTI